MKKFYQKTNDNVIIVEMIYSDLNHHLICYQKIYHKNIINNITRQVWSNRDCYRLNYHGLSHDKISGQIKEFLNS